MQDKAKEDEIAKNIDTYCHRVLVNSHKRYARSQSIDNEKQSYSNKQTYHEAYR